MAAPHQGGKKASLPHRSSRGDDGGIDEAAEDEFEIFDIVVHGGHFDGVGDDVEASAGIFGIEELGADVAHHVEYFVARKGERRWFGRERGADVLGQQEAVFDARFADLLVAGVGAGIEVFVAFHKMVLSFEPAVEALLPPVGLPHSKERAEFLHGRHTAYNVLHLLEGGLADAHGFDYFGGEEVLGGVGSVAHSKRITLFFDNYCKKYFD